MLALRQLLRWYFAIAAVIFLPAGLSSLFRVAHASTPAAAFHLCCIAAALLLVSLLSALAWWTTRTPSPLPNWWPLAASGVNIAPGLLIVRFASGSASSIGPGLLSVALGLAGLIVFSCRGTFHAAEIAQTPASTTPISWREHASTAVFVVAQIAAVRLWSRWIYSHSLPAAGSFSVIVFIVLIFFAALTTSALHEGGHALAARAFRLELLKFHAGPFRWRSVDGQWSFNFHAPGLLTLGGMVGIAPSSCGLQSPWQDLCVVAAGPLANVCTGLLALAGALRAQAVLPQPAWEFLTLIASFSLIAGVFNLFPFQSERGTHSDGARILRLLAAGLDLTPVAHPNLPLAG